jgi:molecular chaperone DnaK (HSP70)
MLGYALVAKDDINAVILVGSSVDNPQLEIAFQTLFGRLKILRGIAASGALSMGVA